MIPHNSSNFSINEWPAQKFFLIAISFDLFVHIDEAGHRVSLFLNQPNFKNSRKAAGVSKSCPRNDQLTIENEPITELTNWIIENDPPI